LESHRYNKSHPNPKAYCFSKTNERKPLLIVLNTCLTFLNSTCLSFTPAQVYSLVRIQPQAISCWFYQRLPNCPTGAHVLLISSKCPTWCQSTFEPCHHDLTCAFMYLSCSVIQENVIFNRAEVRFSLEVLTSIQDVVLDFGT
jgi:hypothetical protein